MAQVSVNSNSKSVSAGWIHITYIQAPSHGGASGYNVPTRNLQNIKHKHPDQPIKKCDTLLHPCVASVEPPWLETIHFKKINIYAQCFLKYYKAHYAITVLILWSWQKWSLRLCMYNIYTQCMNTTALYTYICVCM
jgi:hypothetical protein